MAVRTLTPVDAAAFQQLRLDGLRRCPSAFAAHYDEESQLRIAEIAARIAPTADCVVCGAFQDGALIGIVGLKREARRMGVVDEFAIHELVANEATQCGRVCFGRQKINLSTVFAGQNVGVRQVADQVWLVSFMDYDLGFFDHETWARKRR